MIVNISHYVNYVRDQLSKGLKGLDVLFDYSVQYEYWKNDYDPKNELEIKFPNPIGIIKLAPFPQGNVSNINMISPHELLIFSKYFDFFLHRPAEISFFDLGANVGLHSIICAKLGAINVNCVEPDAQTIKKLNENLNLNKVNANIIQAAIVGQEVKKNMDSAEYIKCINNFTASSLAMTGKTLYGPTDSTNVSLISISDLPCVQVNLKEKRVYKIDIEGSEVGVLKDIIKTNHSNTLCICEISSLDNRDEIFELTNKLNNWRRSSDLIKGHDKVLKKEDLPSRWTDGSFYLESSTDEL